MYLIRFIKCKDILFSFSAGLLLSKENIKIVKSGCFNIRNFKVLLKNRIISIYGNNLCIPLLLKKNQIDDVILYISSGKYIAFISCFFIKNNIIKAVLSFRRKTIIVFNHPRSSNNKEEDLY